MTARGDLSSLRAFTKSLRALPKVVAQRVTSAAAPAITALALQTFDAGENPYGEEWAPGDEGQRVTLHKTGALENQIHYVAIGTKLRVALGVPYAKFQIGKRPVFPRQGDPLPDPYVEALTDATQQACKAAL